jgi:hypothetical protein
VSEETGRSSDGCQGASFTVRAPTRKVAAPSLALRHRPPNPSALPPFLFNPLGVEVGVAVAVAVGGAVGGGVGVAVGRGTSGRPYRFSTACGKPLNNAGAGRGSAVVDLWGAAVHHSLRVQWQLSSFLGEPWARAHPYLRSHGGSPGALDGGRTGGEGAENVPGKAQIVRVRAHMGAGCSHKIWWLFTLQAQDVGGKSKGSSRVVPLATHGRRSTVDRLRLRRRRRGGRRARPRSSPAPSPARRSVRGY